MIIEPMDTASKLYKILIGLVGVNLAFDDKNGKPNEDIIKARVSTFELIRHGVIATDFIARKGLEKEYDLYLKKVDNVVAKIRDGLAQNDDS